MRSEWSMCRSCRDVAVASRHRMAYWQEAEGEVMAASRSKGGTMAKRGARQPGAGQFDRGAGSHSIVQMHAQDRAGGFPRETFGTDDDAGQFRRFVAGKVYRVSCELAARLLEVPAAADLGGPRLFSLLAAPSAQDRPAGEAKGRNARPTASAQMPPKKRVGRPRRVRGVEPEQRVEAEWKLDELRQMIAYRDALASGPVALRTRNTSRELDRIDAIVVATGTNSLSMAPWDLASMWRPHWFRQALAHMKRLATRACNEIGFADLFEEGVDDPEILAARQYLGRTLHQLRDALLPKVATPVGRARRVSRAAAKEALVRLGWSRSTIKSGAMFKAEEP